MVGIKTFGAYIPKYRLDRNEMGKAWGGRGLGGERAVAYFDEDSVTMATEAGMDSGAALYSFTDLLELKVAARLKQAGISLKKSRESIAYLHEHFPDVERPLSEKVFITDGKTIFALTDDPSVLLDTLKKGQTVINLDIAKIEKEIRGQIIQLFPMKEQEREREGDTLDSTSGGF